MQLLPVRLRDRRQARHARLLPAASSRGRRPPAGRTSRSPGSRSRTAAPPEWNAWPANPASATAHGAPTRCGPAPWSWPPAPWGRPSCCCDPGVGGPQVGRNLHIHPACWVGAVYPEEVRGWEGVMQSYYIDQWEPQSILLEATFTPLPFGGAWLPGTGRRAPAGDARLRQHRLNRSPSLRPILWSGRTRRGRLAEDDLCAQRRGRREADLRHRPGGRGPLRRRGDGGLPRTSAAPPSYGRATWRPSRRAASGPPSCASRPSTRWGRRGSPPTRPRESATPTARSTASRACTSPTPALFPTSVGVNPMMTVIAFSKRVAPRRLEPARLARAEGQLRDPRRPSPTTIPRRRSATPPGPGRGRTRALPRSGRAGGRRRSRARSPRRSL